MTQQARQKALLGVLVLVLAFAAWDYLGGGLQLGGDSVPARATTNVSNFVASLTGKLSSAKVDDNGLYKALRVSQKPLDPPFYKSEEPFFFPNEAEAAFSTTVEGVEVSYKGYVQFDDARIAIINGIEYAVGDPFVIEGYVVDRIAPNFVVLAKPDPAGGRGFRVKVPLAEDREHDEDVKVVEQ